MGAPLGISDEAGRAVGAYLNPTNPPETKNARLHVVFQPVARDQSQQPPADGTADIAVGGQTSIPKRRKARETLEKQTG
ncbi:MAG TPA: hypothetical protein VL099_07005 [Candidatus Binatia bacterium]|nr:hypothetical protein [Candidatus Binatia bacterium]